MKTKEELGDELCEYCPLKNKGVFGRDGGFVAGCEGSHCDNAYEIYLERNDIVKKEKGKTLQSTQNQILNKMTDTEKAQFRMGCLIEAGKIKQSLNAHPEVKGYEDKDVVAIAKEFASFVIEEK